MRWFEQIERSHFARQFIKISDQSLQPRIDQNWFLRAGAGRKVDESWNRFEPTFAPSLFECRTHRTASTAILEQGVKQFEQNELLSGNHHVGDRWIALSRFRPEMVRLINRLGPSSDDQG